MYRLVLDVACVLRVSLLVLFVTFSQTSIAQNSEQKKQASDQQCEKVMSYVALNSGLDFGSAPCEDNEYPSSFWFCVEEKVTDDTPFYLALDYCERVAGLR